MKNGSYRNGIIKGGGYMEKMVMDFIKEKCMVEEIAPNTHLWNDLKLDSLHFVRLIVALEELLGIEFPINDLDPEKLEIVQDMVDMCKRQQTMDKKENE